MHARHRTGAAKVLDKVGASERRVVRREAAPTDRENKEGEDIRNWRGGKDKEIKKRKRALYTLYFFTYHAK